MSLERSHHSDRHPNAHRSAARARRPGRPFGIFALVEVAGIEPASPGDRLGLLRAQPAVRSRLRASRRRRARRPARFAVRRRPPGGAAAASLLGDARTRVAGEPGRTAA